VSSSSDTAPIGQLGGYRLLRSLGKGGLGEVFQALDGAGRTVAIKTLRLHDDPDGLQAATFEREARSGRALRHPDIVRLYDSRREGDDAYLVMEYVPGHDLRRHTTPGALLPLPQVLRTAQRVAQALAAAHAQGIVHRDLKPGNVLVHWDSDIVKLADFGLARLGDAFRSRTGAFAGTPAYMAPEQLAEGAVGPATDLYALGVMSFELLTGRLPHEAPSLGALLQRVASRPAPRLRSLRPDLPAEVDELVAHLLHIQPAHRPASAAVVAQRLAQCLRAAPQ
jgi:serine/threonine-protein kinase